MNHVWPYKVPYPNIGLLQGGRRSPSRPMAINTPSAINNHLVQSDVKKNIF